MNKLRILTWRRHGQCLNFCFVAAEGLNGHALQVYNTGLQVKHGAYK